MRALRLQGDVGIEHLEIVDLPAPEPGLGEVRVRVTAASLNYRDLALVEAPFNRDRLPFAPLSDACGVVEAVGPGVTRVAVGERVASMFFPNWIAGGPTAERQANALGGGGTGVAQTQVVLSAEGVAKAPASLSDGEVACLPCAALTAWRALAVEGQITAGETVLLQGTGGVSIFALQFAKAAGATVIITSSSDEKLERAKGLGADHLINYRADPEWGRTAKRLTGGVGVDHVLEVGGAGTLPQSLRALRVGGHLSGIGMLAGGGAGVDFSTLFRGNARIHGITVGSREQFEAMGRAIEANVLRPVIGERFRFEDAQAAFRRMKAGEHFGKIVLDF